MWLSGGQSSYLVEGSCDQQGGSPQELFVDAPGGLVLDKPGAAQIYSQNKAQTPQQQTVSSSASEGLQRIQGKSVAAT